MEWTVRTIKQFDGGNGDAVQLVIPCGFASGIGAGRAEQIYFLNLALHLPNRFT
jgi:hypothetical protein